MYPRTDPRENQIFTGRRGGARPRPLAGPIRFGAIAGGLTAKETHLMDRRVRLRSDADYRDQTVRYHRQLEHVAMHPSHPSLIYSVAEIRAAEFRQEAARQRLARAASDQRAAMSRFASLRQAFGALLVRAGERVQGAQPARPTADLGALTSHLRVVR